MDLLKSRRFFLFGLHLIESFAKSLLVLSVGRSRERYSSSSKSSSNASKSSTRRDHSSSSTSL